MPHKTVGRPGAGIRTAGLKSKDDKKKGKSDPPKPNVDHLLEIEGLHEDTAIRLYRAGYNNIDKIAKADVSELHRIKGMGRKNTPQIQESAQSIIEAKSSDKPPATENPPDEPEEPPAEEPEEDGKTGLLESLGIDNPSSPTNTP